MAATAGVIILGAGSSERFGADKMTLSLLGKTVIERSTEIFEEMPMFTEIVITASEKNIDTVRKLTEKYSKVKAVVTGGKNRMESALNALKYISDDIEFIAVHDGARPLVSRETVEKTFLGALKYGAAIPVSTVKDTLKECKDGFIKATLDRSVIFSAVTPQIFRCDLYKKLLLTGKESYTDDSQLFESSGYKVGTVESNRENIKITYPVDRTIAECLLKETEF